MKFKLDENLSARVAAMLRDAGHDAESVLTERISGCTGQRLFEICAKEGRCLVTLDLDFANVLRFPPAQTGGIAVLRASRNASAAVLDRLIATRLGGVHEEIIANRTWIVEIGRIRVHGQPGT